MPQDRRESSYRVRLEAAELAKGRVHPDHIANGDEQRYAAEQYAMCFTKGLDHDDKTGLLKETADFEAFRSAIDNAYIDDFTDKVPVPEVCERRLWEAPTAGVVYDLEGPDAQAVTMDPAPPLGSDELTFEMAEVYELACLRDVHFSEFEAGNGSNPVKESADRLNKLTFAKQGFPGRGRVVDNKGELDRQTVHRGSSPGVDVGAYLSQFMLIGSPDGGGLSGNPRGISSVDGGRIQYGSITIDQKVAFADPGKDFMQDKDNWLRIQRGYVPAANTTDRNTYTGAPRFIATPRDLATYVHFDALYEAYLNACLILWNMGTPLDPGFATLSGQGGFVSGGVRKMRADPKWPVLNAGGFALYGGPHILTLVTEVATRALKAVRYQKFNNHIRLRPEALAGRIALDNHIKTDYPDLAATLTSMASDMKETLKKIEDMNKTATGTASHFLPMAFDEGSPMHPAYGAGHATVAGACVTILKAFFKTDTVFVTPKNGGEPVFKNFEKGDKAASFIANASGNALVKQTTPPLLTLEGELNKLAANISIGRNMAGVHYFSDYYDSLRMGEEIAIGMLEEQALCYPTDDFVMDVPTYDGGSVRIGAK
ncbi:MAG: vanadium-dependent haloperoxidase [Pseudomonadota bacterium]